MIHSETLNYKKRLVIENLVKI